MMRLFYKPDYVETQKLAPLHRMKTRRNGKVVEGEKVVCDTAWINKMLEVDYNPNNMEIIKNNILVVEDNPVNMILIKSMLLQLLPKASITKVMNGKDAIKYCNKNTPDIIFMDLLMPVMNGFETTIQIRSLINCKNIPIIAVSSDNLKEVKEKSKSSGINDFIAKPINEESLSNAINKWLNDGSDSKKVFTETEVAEEIDVSTYRVLNKKKFLAFITDEPEVASELFEVAKTELNLSCNKLLKHAQNKKKELLKEEAHKLKGTAGSLGLEVMAAKVDSLMSQDKSDSNENISITEKICSSLERLLVLMENEINKIK